MGLITSIRNRLSTYRNRALALLLAHSLGYLLLGGAVMLPGMPDGEWATLDQWIRSVTFTIVHPADTTPITYVDIDDALYRQIWGMPTVTPRGELLKMLVPLAASGASAVVIDVDLAWGERHVGLADFLKDYNGPAPLIFIRHLEETQDGVRDSETPYDDVFATNSAWLHWAHAYFLSDGDGVLRDWLPWVPVCNDAETLMLPAVATLIASKQLTPPAVFGECPTIDESLAYPIVYTEDYGFASGRGASAEDANLWFPDPDAAARRLPASFLLDGSNIDFTALFAGRIAIVGGSHTAGQDLRLTPIGVLPGAVIQANTIHHAVRQLESSRYPEWLRRVIVVLLFLLLSLVSFPVAAIGVILITTIFVGAFSYYPIFGQMQSAALLFVQFRVLAWLFEPFWKGCRECGWRILLPDYIRDKKKDVN